VCKPALSAFNVPQHCYEGLMSASSKGSYFDAYIKKAGYRYRKVRWSFTGGDTANNSMDVRAKHGRCFLSQLFRYFAPRHLNR
jgi:hypothetical protein